MPQPKHWYTQFRDRAILWKRLTNKDKTIKWHFNPITNLFTKPWGDGKVIIPLELAINCPFTPSDFVISDEVLDQILQAQLDEYKFINKDI